MALVQKVPFGLSTLLMETLTHGTNDTLNYCDNISG